MCQEDVYVTSTAHRVGYNNVGQQSSSSEFFTHQATPLPVVHTIQM